jgi:hypothetical protein
MATLQTARQTSAFTAKSRLKQVCKERIVPSTLSDASMLRETVVETISSASPSYGRPATSDAFRLADLEHRQLLLSTAAVYEGWHLVSVQNRPESGVLVAYLVRNRDEGDPTVAIREGRALQIIMDAVGDMKVQHPRRRRETFWQRWLHKLTVIFLEG